ncbi:MAG TPA: acetyl-CoA C-acyltransferase [Anaerolineae bacterium]|nr:acetyl-CoA C-acyltransferase [Anaerolineae bacterium]
MVQGLEALAEALGERARRDEPLALYTRMRVGGPADLLTICRTTEEVVEAVRLARSCGVPWWVLGGGCNVLVADAGVRGLVLIHQADRVQIEGDGTVWAEAGAPMVALARETAGRGLAGLEWAAGLPGTVGGAVVGNAAEWIAREYGLTREELDEYAYNSHMKAIAAIDEGRFKDEIVPVDVPQRKGPPILFDTDEVPRRDTSLEKLARLKPAFQPDGIVTAGNSPGITDGAAAVVVMSRAKAEELGIKPLARILAYDQAAVEPLKIFTAPIFAVRKLWAKTGTTVDDYDLYEVNEAFAAQTLADGRDLNLPWDRVNVNGGAIALGHPIGCSGARVLVTLIYALRQRGLKRGLATLCLGGGEAVAMTIELEE